MHIRFASHNMPIVLSFDVGIRNLAYALCEFDDHHHLVSILDWEVVDLVTAAGSRAKTKSIGIQKAVDFLLRFLVIKLPEWSKSTIDQVVIEQQLARASMLKTLQYTLYTFGRLSFPDARTRMCHAKHKLKADVSFYLGDEHRVFVPTTSTRATKPAATKKLAASRAKAKQYRENKQRCTWMATHIVKFLEARPGCTACVACFGASSKKDDLADCLVQALVADAGF